MIGDFILKNVLYTGSYRPYFVRSSLSFLLVLNLPKENEYLLLHLN